MGGGSSNSGDVTKTRRYAPYIESHHDSFLNTVSSQRSAIVDSSPFTSYVDVEIDVAFFGVGYMLSNFPSLYDMYGKHMAGLDVEVLWDDIFSQILSKEEIDDTTTEEMKQVDDKLEEEITAYQVSMRNINAIATSSFIVDKAVLEDRRVKAFAVISLDSKMQMMESAEKGYEASLNWEKKTITVYAEIMKDYYMYKSAVDDVNYIFAGKNALWPFTVLSFEGYALGTMQGTLSWRKTMDPRERSDLSTGLSIASYTVSGAFVGAEVGGPWGAVIGGVVGAVVGIAMMLLE